MGKVRPIIFVVSVMSIYSCSGVMETNVRKPVTMETAVRKPESAIMETVVQKPESAVMETDIQKPESAVMETAIQKPESAVVRHADPPKSPLEGGQGGVCLNSDSSVFKKIASEIKSIIMPVLQKSTDDVINKWQSALSDIENNVRSEPGSTGSYCKCKDATHKKNCLQFMDISAGNSINAFELQLFSEYSDKLGINFDGTENIQLIRAIDEWLGTSYSWGGCSKYGIDCSCFVKSVYKDVYDIELSRSSSEIYYNDLMPVNKEDLQEGDLLFFKMKRKKISHVGLYLKDNKFAHASQRKGVVIDNLANNYYRKRFFSGGRPTEKLSANISEKLGFYNNYKEFGQQYGQLRD